ncbi:MAG: ABC transporter permease [Bacteroidales bacterium]|jgi:putative ABC transport system permease protein|nr:ABC transporter permease [Bacteroidales bacterium]
MISRYFHDIEIAIESLLGNKLKSILTALGIIFGTAAVISMLAIGNGAQQEILEQIKMVGVNNIVITPTIDLTGGENGESSDGSDSGNGELKKEKFSPGLTMKDLETIKKVVPSVKKITPEIIANSFVVQNGKRVAAKVIGVNNDYFDVYNINFEKGRYFSDYQADNGIPVCVIGANISAKVFSNTDPVNQYLKFGHVWLKVIGVLEKSNVNLSAADNAGVNLVNDNVYIPVQTMLLRYMNRALINSKSIGGSSFYGGGRFFSFSGGQESTNTNGNQLDKIIVQVQETEQITNTTEILSRMLLRRHMNVKDFEITVPELLLKQQQRTKDIFNIVLGAIASISLIVGGIGIMNIMFATVMERIKEIGIRLALGAKKADIIAQFLSEAILISVSGGLIGVFLGVVFSKLIMKFAGILTIISPGSIIVAFGVSAVIGVIFGISPAKRAADKDPIESLRYE